MTVTKDADGDLLVRFVCSHEGCGTEETRRFPSRGPAPSVCDDCIERGKKMNSNPTRLWPTTCVECSRRRNDPRRVRRWGGATSSPPDQTPFGRNAAAFSEEVSADIRTGVYRAGRRIVEGRP